MLCFSEQKPGFTPDDIDHVSVLTRSPAGRRHVLQNGQGQVFFCFCVSTGFVSTVLWLIQYTE